MIMGVRRLRLPGGARRGRMAAAVGAAAVLLAFGATMTVLFTHEVGAHDRAVATRAALRSQLAALQATSAGLQAQLKAAQDKQLDPAGYERIKACVQQYAKDEEEIAKLLADPNFPGDRVGNGTVVSSGQFKDKVHPSTTCTDAARYLK